MLFDGVSVPFRSLLVNNSFLLPFLFSWAHSLVLILLARSSKSFIISRVVGGSGVGANFRFLLNTIISLVVRVTLAIFLMYDFARSICCALRSFLFSSRFVFLYFLPSLFRFVLSIFRQRLVPFALVYLYFVRAKGLPVTVNWDSTCIFEFVV